VLSELNTYTTQPRLSYDKCSLVKHEVNLMSSQPGYDAIVIGSGIGGLAFPSIMAKLRKWRVLVLERHFKIGGFTHTFTRPGGWSWDVGLHYVGEMGEGMMGRRLFDLITEGKVKWNPLPDVYDVFVYPNLQVRACKGEANFRNALTDAFPNERSRSIEYRYLNKYRGPKDHNYRHSTGCLQRRGQQYPANGRRA
jgi:phytoene dehydrogenase-like protein